MLLEFTSIDAVGIMILRANLMLIFALYFSQQGCRIVVRER